MDKLIDATIIYGYLVPVVILFIDFLVVTCRNAWTGKRYCSSVLKKQLMMFVPAYNYFWALFVVLDWTDWLGKLLSKYLFKHGIIMMNLDEMAEKYLGAVETQKKTENKDFDGKFTRGDMETCYVTGASESQVLQVGQSGSFGQAIGSLKHGFLVAREGWNGKGMFLFMRPFDVLKDDFIIDTVKSLPYNFKQWVKNHPNERKERFFTQYICMKAADGSIVNGWLASQTDMLADDWVLVDPEKV